MSSRNTSLHPETEAFLREIVADLRPLETERVRLRQKTIRYLVISACGTALVTLSIPIALVILIPWDEVVVGIVYLLMFVMLVLVALVAVFAACMIHRVQQGWARRVVDAVVPLICDAFGGIQYQPEMPHLNFVALFERLGVVEKSNDKELAHYFHGIYRDTRFEFVHAILYFRRRRGREVEQVLVLNGLLFRIQMPIHVVEPIIISPNDFIMLSRRRSDMPRVLLGHPLFDEKFRVSFSYETSYSKGEALIRHVVTPDLQHALLNINERESTLSGGRVAFNAGLMHDRLYLALSRMTANPFLGSINFETPRPFLRVPFFLRAHSGPALEQAVHAMLDDVHTVYRVIDRLHGHPASDEGR